MLEINWKAKKALLLIVESKRFKKIKPISNNE
jgi:hypothetical protein